MNLGTAQVIRGDSRHLPLASDSVDLVVTSPPYFALRSYTDGGVHYERQIGAEATPDEFVSSLLEVTAECVRVLKPSGSLWVNLGDKYAGAGYGNNADMNAPEGRQRKKYVHITSVRPKSLLGIPWRYALRCIDDLGLILRAEVIWSKPNGLPESVTDRVRRSHEQWFHFVLNPRYFSAVDEIREPHKPGQHAAALSFNRNGRETAPGQSVAPHRVGREDQGLNPLGKLPGSVWTDTEPGASITRSVLTAVAAGGITIDEGERILWAQRETASWPMSTDQATAGSGSDGKTPAATARPQTSGTPERTGHTESPTACSSDPSRTDSPSITSAATSHASTPNTSSPSPGQRTSDAHGPSRPTASGAGAHSTTPTPNGPGTGRPASGADPATSNDSVWVVPTEPLRVPPELGVDHFAAFPTSFPKRIIQGWSPAGVCVACGEGRRPVSDRDRRILTGNFGSDNAGHEQDGRSGQRAESLITITGYACDCPEPTADTRPAVILDPFGGTGTTAMVAKALGRHGISVDMSADYCRLAEWRTNDRDQLAKVLGVAKADPVSADEQSLFDLMEGTA